METALFALAHGIDSQSASHAYDAVVRGLPGGPGRILDELAWISIVPEAADRVSDLEDDLKNAHDDLEEAQERIDELEREVAQDDETIEGLREEIEDLKDQLRALETVAS